MGARESINPGALRAPNGEAAKGEAPKGDAAASAGDPKKRSLKARVAVLMAILTSAPTPERRARLERKMTASRAVALGSEVDPAGVAADFVRCLALLSPWIIAGRLGVYGARRARYGLDLVSRMLPALAARQAHERSIETTRKRSAPVASLAPAAESEARRALSEMIEECEAQAEIEESLSPAGVVTEVARGKERIAAQVRYVRRNVSEADRADVGLTSEVLDALEGLAEHALERSAAVSRDRLAKQALRAELAEPCGRLIREMLGAADRMRAVDASIPAASSRYARPSSAKDVDGGAPEPPTPPPAPDAPQK